MPRRRPRSRWREPEKYDPLIRSKPRFGPDGWLIRLLGRGRVFRAYRFDDRGGGRDMARCADRRAGASIWRRWSAGFGASGKYPRAAKCACTAQCRAFHHRVGQRRGAQIDAEAHVAGCVTASVSPSATPTWAARTAPLAIRKMTADAIRQAAADFPHCARVWPDAARRGVTMANYRHFTADLTPDLRIMDLMDSQPEFTKSIWDYLDILVNDNRVNKGREILARYRAMSSMRSSALMASTVMSSLRSGASSRTTRRWAATAACCARPRRSPASAAVRPISRTSSSPRWRSSIVAIFVRAVERLMGRRVRPDAIHADLVQAATLWISTATGGATSSIPSPT